jgi:hypothetical protein
MFSHLTLFSSLAYFFVTFLDNQLWKYILKPTTTILIIGVALESGKNKSQAKTLG